MSLLQPKVSVVMPVYNGEKYLLSAIKSILSQDFTDFEFIVVDDGSTDQTSKILASTKDSRLKIITHSTNLGIVISLNDGIQACRGKYIARMDCDDLSDPKRFSTQVQFLNENKDHAAVGSFVKLINPHSKVLYTIEQPSRDLAIKRHLLHDSCIAHGSVMMRKSVLLKVGMYSESSMVRHAEDYDLFTRIAAKYKLANIPEYLYTRTEHSSSISHQNYSEQQKSASYISNRAKKLISIGKKPSFSILMPTYNNASHIGEAIKSVIAQSFKDWELIIIDDGSTDNTENVVKPYLRDKRIIYLKNPFNIGKGKTRKRLVVESLAPIFGELDADDALDPNAIKVMLKAHKDNAGAGLIYSQFVYCDDSLKRIGIGTNRRGNPEETNLHSYYASAFRTYKRSIFEKTAGFDPNLSGAEDKDLIYKIEEVAPIHFVDKELYKYRVGHHKSYNDVVSGLINNMKAVYFAYIRRGSSGYKNLSLLQLIRYMLNQLIVAIKYKNMSTNI